MELHGDCFCRGNGKGYRRDVTNDVTDISEASNICIFISFQTPLLCKM